MPPTRHNNGKLHVITSMIWWEVEINLSQRAQIIRHVAELPSHLGVAEIAAPVAALQQRFCFYSETAHFNLHQPRRALSFTCRGGQVHKQSIFKPGEPQCANACGFFNGGWPNRNK
jgi:hypothetical protein